MLESINLEETIAKVPDYPKPGVLFYDISTLLMNTQAWTATMKRLAGEISQYKPDIIAAIESRGFLLASPVAIELAVGVQMIRKKGKLPGETLSHTYDLEYGHDTLEIQKNSDLSSSVFFNNEANIIRIKESIFTDITSLTSICLLYTSDAADE